MPLNSAFKGHGLFCYQPSETRRHFAHYPVSAELPPERELGGYAGALSAFKDMGISNVWVRLFGHEGAMPLQEVKSLVAALRAVNIGVAGWGYSHGDRWQDDLKAARGHSDELGLDAFVADIEPARKLDGMVSKWREQDITAYIDALAARFGKDNLGVSTWPVLRIQTDQSVPTLDLMKSIAYKVSFFAPQAYWMSYPTTVHYAATGFSEHDFPRKDPASFVRLVLHSWKEDGFFNKISITGQAYWGEGAPAPSVLERKISEFAASFTGWNQIVGLTWWHAGNERAMSMKMVEAIKNAKFASKPFQEASWAGS